MRLSAARRAITVQIEALEARQLLSALTPAQVAHAYGFDQISFLNSVNQTIKGDGRGQTIAIVDAYDDPNIVSDLKTFDARYGISNNDGQGAFCLTKTAPQSRTQANGGWAQEISLDVEWAHAMAPGAHILLVEAKSASLSNLLSAVDYARKQSSVTVISMSWGASEFSSESSYDSYFTTPSGHAGVTFIASSGDNGSPAGWPAISSNVIAVGGTSLYLNSDNTWSSETGWSGSGGGTSAYESIPAYQTPYLSGTKRGNPDVAYDADPYTGFAVYDSYAYQGMSGWLQFGGTSAGSPQWAALIAITNQGRVLGGRATLDGGTQTLPAIYGLPGSDFHDITSGSNGGYSAGAGYDEVTGRGSPIANLIARDLSAWTGTAAPLAVTTGSTSGTLSPMLGAKSTLETPISATGDNNDSGILVARRQVDSLPGALNLRSDGEPIGGHHA